MQNQPFAQAVTRFYLGCEEFWCTGDRPHAYPAMTESERCTGCGPALAGIPSIPGDGGVILAVRPSPRPC